MTRGLVRGALVEVDVEKAVYLGQGLARHDGQVVFIPRAQPGERLKVRIEEVGRGYARGSIEARLRPSGEARESPCPLFARCGGCSYQDLGYDAQRSLKEAVLRDSLARAGVAWDEAIPLRPSPEDGWRTRASMHLSRTSNGLALGFFAEKSHRVVDADFCRQLSPAMNAAARSLRAAIEAQGDRADTVRGIELAESADGRQLVAVVDVSGDVRTAVDWAPRLDRTPGLTGFAVAAGSTLVGAVGELHVDADVHGLRLRAHVRSFFQGNRFLAIPLVDEVAALVPEGGSVLDLYCGVGLFALPLAARAERVAGLELVPQAVEDARSNVEASGLGARVEIARGDVARGLPWPVSLDERIVLDPPRAGAGPGVVAAIAARRPLAIVYVSCDPPTLARDLKAFADRGYRPDAIRAFDLFPDTFHLETVVRLRRM